MAHAKIHKLKPLTVSQNAKGRLAPAFSTYKAEVEMAGGKTSIARLHYYSNRDGEFVIVMAEGKVGKSFPNRLLGALKDAKAVAFSGKEDTEERHFRKVAVDGKAYFVKEVGDLDNYSSPIHEIFLSMVLEHYKPGGTAYPVGVLLYKRLGKLYVVSELLEGYFPLNRLVCKNIANEQAHYSNLGRLAERIGLAVGRLHRSADVSEGGGSWTLFFFHGDLHPGNVMVKVNFMENGSLRDMDYRFIDVENGELWVADAELMKDEEAVLEAYMEVWERRMEELKKLVHAPKHVAGVMGDIRGAGHYQAFAEGYLQGLGEGDVVRKALGLTEGDVVRDLTH